MKKVQKNRVRITILCLILSITFALLAFIVGFDDMWQAGVLVAVPAFLLIAVAGMSLQNWTRDRDVR